MGGLGPTEDDLTREAVAEALGLELHRSEELLEKLKQRFAARGYKLTPNNFQQADVITGATVLPNPNGTAPGQWITGQYEGRDRLIILLPGPPFELRAMFEEQCVDRLRAKLPPAYIATRVLKVAMLGESLVDPRRAHLQALHDVQTTILRAPETFSSTRSRAPIRWRLHNSASTTSPEVEDELGEALMPAGRSLGRSSVSRRCGTLRCNRESCTGARDRITSISGSSHIFWRGRCLFQRIENRVRRCTQNLVISMAQSAEVAAASGRHSQTARQLSASGLRVSLDQLAAAKKPVGLAHMPGQRRERRSRAFPGDRKRVRWFASQLALDMVRRKLM
jgi:nicotinamide-nucleotide amidase